MRVKSTTSVGRPALYRQAATGAALNEKKQESADASGSVSYLELVGQPLVLLSELPDEGLAFFLAGPRRQLSFLEQAGLGSLHQASFYLYWALVAAFQKHNSHKNLKKFGPQFFTHYGKLHTFFQSTNNRKLKYIVYHYAH